jgi:hypothetical protein
MNISKKKKENFDNIFNLVDSNNIVFDIELFRKLFSSDFFENFIIYTKNKIETIVTNNNIFYLHINISLCSVSDFYNYDKILKFAQLLHEFTDKLNKIYIYGNSSIFENFIYMISNSLNYDLTKKIIFENLENYYSKFNKISILDNR